MNIFKLSVVVACLRDLVERASGKLGSGERFVPSPERGKVIWAARTYLLLIAMIAATSLLTWSTHTVKLFPHFSGRRGTRPTSFDRRFPDPPDRRTPEPAHKRGGISWTGSFR